VKAQGAIRLRVRGDGCSAASPSLSVSSLSSAGRRRAIDPLELYASAIDTSDYVGRVAPVARRLLPNTGELLDVGAGGGQLGAALRERGRPWTAIEPSAAMRARLARLHSPPRLVAAGWHEADVADGSHDTVLAATMPALFDEPEAFLARCRTWSRRAVVWIVPAHRGPRGLCFAGCLPSRWHREDETPGIDIVLGGLGAPSRPDDIAFVDWTFSGVVTDLPELAAYLADRLGWAATDPRRPELADHLAAQAVPDAAGVRLNIARKSAVLVWGKQ
jgi:SAM-dependent methyltransferase